MIIKYMDCVKIIVVVIGVFCILVILICESVSFRFFVIVNIFYSNKDSCIYILFLLYFYFVNILVNICIYMESMMDKEM